MTILIDPEGLLSGMWLRTQRETNRMTVSDSVHYSTPCGVSIYMPWFKPEVK